MGREKFLRRARKKKEGESPTTRYRLKKKRDDVLCIGTLSQDLSLGERKEHIYIVSFSAALPYRLDKKKGEMKSVESLALVRKSTHLPPEEG